MHIVLCDVYNGATYMYMGILVMCDIFLFYCIMFNSPQTKENSMPITMADSNGQMLQVPPLSARPGSRGSEDGSMMLNEVQVTGRPPLHPTSARY